MLTAARNWSTKADARADTRHEEFPESCMPGPKNPRSRAITMNGLRLPSVPVLPVIMGMILCLATAACTVSEGDQGIKDGKKISTGDRPDQTVRDLPSSRPRQSGPASRPNPREDSEQRGERAAAEPEMLRPLVEKLDGYKAASEYFILKSVHYPHAITVVTLPLDYDKKKRKKYPLIIVFGGAGECARPPREGALAWLKYYKIDEAIRALDRDRLETADFRGLVSDAELRLFNRRLDERPYSGVIVACPYSPPLTVARDLEFPEYETYIMEDLIPALKAHYRIDPARIGVDGVSMGGSRSMYYGFKYPEVFSSIGSVQGAFGPHFGTYEALIREKKDLLRKRSLQLVTSDGDVMAPPVAKMRDMLKANGISHSYHRLSGPHDYVFNQGPGAISLLVFHHEARVGRMPGPAR
jgi:iron(III)-salmochelin esterase